MEKKWEDFYDLEQQLAKIIWFHFFYVIFLALFRRPVIVRWRRDVNDFHVDKSDSFLVVTRSSESESRISVIFDGGQHIKMFLRPLPSKNR